MYEKHPLRRLVAIAAVAALAVVAVQATAGASAGAKKPTGSVIKFGWVGTQTSSTSTTAVKLQQQVLEAWAKWQNAHGGLLGHLVEIVSRDDKGDPAVAKQVVQELVEVEKVVAIVGVSATATEGGFAQYVLDNKIPVVGGAEYTGNWFSNAMFYPVSTTVLSVLWGQAKAAADAGFKKVAQLLCNTSAACTGAKPIFAGAVTSNGMEIVSDQTADPAQPNYTAECLSAKNAGATVFRASGINLPNVVRDCNRQQYDPVYLSSELQPTMQALATDPNFAQFTAYGEVSAFPPFKEFPQTKTYWKAMRKYHPEYLPPNGKQFANYGLGATQARAGAEALKKALENAGVTATTTVTSATVIQGLAKFAGETLGGIAPPLTFSDGTKPNPQNKCFFVTQVKKRKYSAPKGLTPVCQP